MSWNSSSPSHNTIKIVIFVTSHDFFTLCMSHLNTKNYLIVCGVCSMLVSLSMKPRIFSEFISQLQTKALKVNKMNSLKSISSMSPNENFFYELGKKACTQDQNEARPYGCLEWKCGRAIDTNLKVTMIQRNSALVWLSNGGAIAISISLDQNIQRELTHQVVFVGVQ